ncbi:hypothetical protein CIG2463D_1208 [Campylobacter iguaniorum]|uniref:type II secretion system protein n=1 Tax=Campylobacter iguaniorum TaxID=1244531 RepID=UPI00073A1E91|nr:type II secretion system protein [Campylobacter iguaniorum]ALV24779.1 hypothetical protein CIG2463D_1208 [Campylobacter iguaniorum]
MKKAFTLIELVIVITILAILSSIGTDIFDRVYMNYVQTRSLQKLELETGILIEQIAKRLENRIKPTLAVSTYNGSNKNTGHITLADAGNIDWKDNKTEITWFNQMYETQRYNETNNRNIGWSGFINLESIKANGDTLTITTPGSHLQTVLKEKYGKNNTPVLIFKGNDTDIADYYKVYDNYSSKYAHKINIISDETFTIDVRGKKPVKIYEQYWLAAYIIGFRFVATDPTTKLKTLNYIEFPFSSEGGGTLMSKNVSSLNFKSTADNGVIVKLCLADPNFNLTPDEKDTNKKRYLEVCKTKVVL